MKNFYALGVVFVLALFGCGSQNDSDSSKMKETRSTSEKNEQNEFSQGEGVASSKINEFQPFYVYLNKGAQENHYAPSGFMPSGKCILFDDNWKEQCHSAETCIKTVYDVACSLKDEKWSGIYWLNPPNNWGKRKGGFNLTGAQKLTFWARGEQGGEQIKEVTIGGISGDFPDTDVATIGPIILTPEWKEYTLDLRGKDLSYISGGFAWSTSTDVNPEKCTFYLDDIRFE